MTLWFHPLCAAYKRPQSILDALQTLDPQSTGVEPGLQARLEQAANKSLAHRRLPRIDGAERSPSGQATCRSCRQRIERGSWRIRIVFYEEGRFLPGGYIHLNCRLAYFETEDVLDALLHFSPSLTSTDREELGKECGAKPAAALPTDTSDTH